MNNRSGFIEIRNRAVECVQIRKMRCITKVNANDLICNRNSIHTFVCDTWYGPAYIHFHLVTSFLFACLRASFIRLSLCYVNVDIAVIVILFVTKVEFVKTKDSTEYIVIKVVELQRMSLSGNELTQSSFRKQ